MANYPPGQHGVPTAPYVQPVIVMAPPSNGLGVAGFVCSILGFFTCGLLGPLGLIMSVAALAKEPRGFAVAGTILGLISGGWLFLGGGLLLLGMAGAMFAPPPSVSSSASSSPRAVEGRAGPDGKAELGLTDVRLVSAHRAQIPFANGRTGEERFVCFFVIHNGGIGNVDYRGFDGAELVVGERRVPAIVFELPLRDDKRGSIAAGKSASARVAFPVEEAESQGVVRLPGKAIGRPGEWLEFSVSPPANPTTTPTASPDPAPTSTPEAAPAAEPLPKSETPQEATPDAGEDDPSDPAKATTSKRPRTPRGERNKPDEPAPTPSADQPLLDAGHKFRPREWNTADGKSTVQASFVSFADGKVKLRRVDNQKEVSIALDRLSEADQEYLRQQKFKADRLAKPKPAK